jgi:hypothetical protein
VPPVHQGHRSLGMTFLRKRSGVPLVHHRSAKREQTSLNSGISFLFHLDLLLGTSMTYTNIFIHYPTSLSHGIQNF